MKRLLIIRHGKSSWDHPGLRDIQRPLKGRGRRDGAVMGAVLVAKGIQADLVLSSPAVRANSTAQIISKAIGYPETSIEIEESFYFSGIDAIVRRVQQVPDEVNTLFIFGHNPDFTSLANHFTSPHIVNLPTTGVVAIDFTVESWKDIDPSNARRAFFEVPKNHR